jgi:hypothetical protein
MGDHTTRSTICTQPLFFISHYAAVPTAHSMQYTLDTANINRYPGLLPGRSAGGSCRWSCRGPARSAPPCPSRPGSGRKATAPGSCRCGTATGSTQVCRATGQLTPTVLQHFAVARATNLSTGQRGITGPHTAKKIPTQLAHLYAAVRAGAVHEVASPHGRAVEGSPQLPLHHLPGHRPV